MIIIANCVFIAYFMYLAYVNKLVTCDSNIARFSKKKNNMKLIHRVQRDDMIGYEQNAVIVNW